MPLSHARCAKSAIVWMVFLETYQHFLWLKEVITYPSPISSARIQFKFLEWMLASHSKPACWYGRKTPRSNAGGLMKAFGSHSTGATAYGLRYRGIRMSSVSSPISDPALSTSCRGGEPSTPDADRFANLVGTSGRSLSLSYVMGIGCGIGTSS